MIYRMAASHRRLLTLIEHLDAWAITLIDVVTEGDEMVVTLDAELPEGAAAHLELVEVV